MWEVNGRRLPEHLCGGEAFVESDSPSPEGLGRSTLSTNTCLEADFSLWGPSPILTRGVPNSTGCALLHAGLLMRAEGHSRPLGWPVEVILKLNTQDKGGWINPDDNKL